MRVEGLAQTLPAALPRICRNLQQDYPGSYNSPEGEARFLVSEVTLKGLAETLPGALPRMRSQIASHAILILLNDPGVRFTSPIKKRPPP